MPETPNLSGSAKLYQERRLPAGRNTRRLPTPRSNLCDNLVHTIPLSPPFPTPDVLQRENDHPPDAGHTSPWPWGIGEEEIT